MIKQGCLILSDLCIIEKASTFFWYCKIISVFLIKIWIYLVLCMFYLINCIF